MKLNRIVAACAALSAASAFAAATSTCVTSATANDLISNCAPEVVFYFAGASAQEPAIKTVMNAGGNGIFDTAKPLVRVTSTASTLSTHGAKNSTGWYGFGAAGTVAAGKRVAVIYNKVNGSGAGVLQFMNGSKTAAIVGLENASNTIETQTVAAAKAGTAFTACTIAADTVTTDSVTNTAVCTNSADILGKTGAAGGVVHMALSDVKATELDTSLGIKKAPKGTEVATSYQGFGLIVSPTLYAALQARDIARGTVTATCTPSSTTVDCQPSVASADFAGLLNGTVTTAKSIVGASGDDAINVVRRVKFSGTQAAMNIAFGHQAGVNAKAALNSSIPFINTVDGLAGIVAPTTGSVTVTVAAGTGDVTSAVKTAAGYAIGMVSLENAASSFTPAKFVKLDGMSPDASSTGTLASSKNRFALQSGYPLQFQMFAYKNAKLAAGTAQNEVADKIIAGLTDATTGDLAGIAYVGAADSAKAATYGRVDGNNYKTLVRK